ncbi:MAG: DNA translocase FtsK [Ruminococcus sp.]|nr:DNA translocase FtsK [Ruminococcus sp.]
MAAKKPSPTKKRVQKNKGSKKPAPQKQRANNTTKRNVNTQKPPVKQSDSQESRRFWSYILFFYGILEVFLTFVKGDGLWAKLYEINRGLFGISVFLFAPLIIYVAILIATDKSQHTVVAKILKGLMFMLILSAGAQIIQVGSIDGADFLTKLSVLYNDGTELNGGGLAGAILGWPLLWAFKKVGATIVIILLAFTFVMLLTNITLPQLLKGLSKPFVGGYKAVSKDRQDKRNKPLPPKKTLPVNNSVKDNDYFVDASKLSKGDFDEPENIESIDESDSVLQSEENKQAQKQELEKIAKQAVSGGDNNADTEPIEDKPVYVEQDGQTTLFEKDEAVSTYTYPPIDILKYSSNSTPPELAQQEIMEKSEKLVETLETFGVKTRIIGIHRGPSVTRYELQPAAGVKVKQITNLADDIALNLAANGVRIEAPIPGKAAIGIEIPNNHRDSVSMRELIDSDDYRNAKGKLTFAVGKDIEGKIVIGDIASMPHMLIAGTTGSGKSVFTNSIILNILFHASPDEVKLILIDPKKVEFPMYNGIPHLLIPVVTEPLKAAGALGWAVNEMMRRYKLFEANGTKNLEDYNQFVDENPELERTKLAQVVIIIDEFADLMMAAKSEVEESVMRLAQLARAAGMHMLIATQSPRVDVLTGLIKANIPSRTALSVSNNTDSRVILDEVGAEKLLGKGDMLYKPVGMPKPVRIQSGFASTAEIRNLVNYLKGEHKTEYSEEVIHEVEKNTPQPKENPVAVAGDGETGDELTNQAISIIVETGNASTAFLQRKLKLGFPRAARIMDEIEEMGIIGPQEGSKPRKINITKEEWYERQGLS